MSEGAGPAESSPDRARPGPPMAGIKVLDFTRVLSGPFATLLLADLGAQVIKVEDPTSGDSTRAIPPFLGGESHYFLALNRSKLSLAIDLKCSQGIEIISQLASSCDVIVENFRPGVMERLGLGSSRLLTLNERLVYCSISAFGQNGPYVHRPGFDLIIQGLSGAMSLTGEPGGPPLRMGLSMGDLGAGLFAAVGILAALLQREATGCGRFIDVSMLDGLLSLLTYHASSFWLTGQGPQPVGSSHPSFVPYGAYRASDGYVVLAPFSDAFWPKICEALGLQEFVGHPKYATNVERLKHREEVDKLVADILREKPVADWYDRLAECDVPFGPVLSVEQALNDAQVSFRQLVGEVNHQTVGAMHVLAPGLRFDDPAAAWTTPPMPAPVLGQHTRLVLSELAHLSGDKIEELIKGGVVADQRAR